MYVLYNAMQVNVYCPLTARVVIMPQLTTRCRSKAINTTCRTSSSFCTILLYYCKCQFLINFFQQIAGREIHNCHCKLIRQTITFYTITTFFQQTRKLYAFFGNDRYPKFKLHMHVYLPNIYFFLQYTSASRLFLSGSLILTFVSGEPFNLHICRIVTLLSSYSLC